MKKSVVKIVLGMAVTAAIGTGAAAGNGFIVSSVLASNSSQNTPVITPDTKADNDKTEAVPLKTDTKLKENEKAGQSTVISADDKGKETIIYDESLTEEQKLKQRKDLERLQKDLDGGEASETGTPSFVTGTPSANDLTKDQATKTAKDAILKEYALTDETLSKFSIDTAFNIADPESPVWSITFYPTNQNDFSEIGTYNITIDSLSGKIIKILSAADGVG